MKTFLAIGLLVCVLAAYVTALPAVAGPPTVYALVPGDAEEVLQPAESHWHYGGYGYGHGGGHWDGGHWGGHGHHHGHHHHHYGRGGWIGGGWGR